MGKIIEKRPEAYLKELCPTLSPKLMEEVGEIWQPFQAKRKTLLCALGETEKYLYYVVKGVQRVYFDDEHGREATLVFSYPYSFAGVLDSFLTQSPSLFYFECLTSSKMYRASFSSLQGLMLRHPELQASILGLTAGAMRGLLLRMSELQSFSSEEKFKTLLQRSPQVLQQVPHKYLANYLGMDASQFSRLLNSRKI